MQFLNFYIKNGNIKQFLKTKSDQNIHQNAPNCTILKTFLWGHAPAPPYQSAFPNLKTNSWPPPNPGDAPEPSQNFREGG